jgi:hypothetical protein
MHPRFERFKVGWLSSDGDEKIFMTFVGQGHRHWIISTLKFLLHLKKRRSSPAVPCCAIWIRFSDSVQSFGGLYPVLIIPFALDAPYSDT